MPRRCHAKPTRCRRPAGVSRTDPSADLAKLAGMPPSGYRALALSGTQYARRVLRGEAAVLEVPVGSFVADLAMALRPHFFALSSVAALAGASAVSSVLSPGILVAAGIGGLGWGVGQLLNDLLDREADSVNAPDRAIAAGRLPAGPTLFIAALLGVVLAVGTALVHPLAWLLAIAASLMIVVYNAAKRWPLLGNLAHGALMATAAAIGASAALPRGADPTSYLGALFGAWRTFLFVGAIAAWYLQSNYEKDRPGDRTAGYLTLATILSGAGQRHLARGRDRRHRPRGARRRAPCPIRSPRARWPPVSSSA